MSGNAPQLPIGESRAERPIFAAANYELLDFGGGRKLERFGPIILDRPCAEPAARIEPQTLLWPTATARFELDADAGGPQRGRWIPVAVLREKWTVACVPLRMELKPTEYGHVGLFPEQIENWQWTADTIRTQAAGTGLQGSLGACKILNLFAHTGGSTLAAAAAGAEVVHVDSARGIVAWARRNAELSGLTAAPIRWIVEDAARFVRRELARGNRYDAVILDPPSYGHGPAGQSWKLDRDLAGLLRDCAELTAGCRQFMLLTCHSAGITHTVASRLLANALQEPLVESCELSLTATDGRRLPSGVAARWSKQES